MLYITELDNANRAQFKQIMPTTYHAFLDPDAPQAENIIVGASMIQTLAGVALALPDPYKIRSYQVPYFFVRPSYRERGIEWLLLEELERRTCAKRQTQLEIPVRRPAGVSTSQTLLRALQERNYEIRFDSTLFYIRGHDTFPKEQWFQLRIPEGYELFLWKDLTFRDMADLEARDAERRKSGKPYLDPFDVDPIDPYTSVGMRKKTTGEVVGWMINAAQSPEQVWFRRLCVVPSERGRGLFYPLLSNAIQLYINTYQVAIFKVVAENIKMKKVIMKMMGHLCEDILECYWCQKTFSGKET